MAYKKTLVQRLSVGKPSVMHFWMRNLGHQLISLSA